MDKIFAQPFLGAMNGHSDGISVMAKSSAHLTHVLSGSMDGEIMYNFNKFLGIKWTKETTFHQRSCSNGKRSDLL